VSADKIIEEIKKMTVMDLAALVKALEEEFGVSAAVPVAAAAVAAPGAGGGSAAAEEEEQTEFDVILKEVGQQKINVIKESAPSLPGLKEAKDLVDGAPNPVKQAVNKARLRTSRSSSKRSARPSRSSSR